MSAAEFIEKHLGVVLEPWQRHIVESLWPDGAEGACAPRPSTFSPPKRFSRSPAHSIVDEVASRMLVEGLSREDPARRFWLNDWVPAERSRLADEAVGDVGARVPAPDPRPARGRAKTHEAAAEGARMTYGFDIARDGHSYTVVAQDADGLIRLVALEEPWERPRTSWDDPTHDVQADIRAAIDAAEVSYDWAAQHWNWQPVIVRWADCYGQVAIADQDPTVFGDQA